MLAVHALVRNGYSYDAVMQMDEQDVEDWLATATEYNRLKPEDHTGA